jgi:hypothetical protein
MTNQINKLKEPVQKAAKAKEPVQKPAKAKEQAKPKKPALKPTQLKKLAKAKDQARAKELAKAKNLPKSKKQPKPKGQAEAQEQDVILLFNILFKWLKNPVHYDYCRRFYEELLAAGPDLRNAVGTARITGFGALLALEGELMRWAYKSVLTEEIAEADRRLDLVLSAIIAHVRAAVYGDDADVIAAAKRLRVMLREHGRVSRKAYNEQEGAVRAMLDSMHGPYAADVTAIGLEAQVARLQSAYDVFAALLKQRDADMEDKPKENFAAVRRKLDALYRVIAGIINAGAKLGQSQEFAAFIRILNPLIERLNRQFHRARADLKHASIAPIADMPFTEKPVTPPLRVFFVTADGTEELELGRHYNVTYKNNIDVGNAEAAIHGKGDYKGSKTISFAIKRGITVDAAANARTEEEFRLELETQAKEAVEAAKAAKEAEKAARAAAKLEAEARAKARANAKAEALAAAEEAEE